MKLLGIAIGGTKTAVISAEIVNDELLIKDKFVFSTTPESDEQTINDIINIIDSNNLSFEFISIKITEPVDPTLRGEVKFRFNQDKMYFFDKETTLRIK